ncbi:hypothetical protein [Streptomyces sp. NPDC000931]|uniref:hypothetical protein n=1 Tax=Streptomyces sp. NPDC000931 TaxID=3154372 RepID=UPI003332C6D4
MISMEWDGLTDREHFGDLYRQERDRFADRARDADWGGLFEELGRRPGWVDLPRPGNHSGFAPPCTRRRGTARIPPSSPG